MVLDYRLTDYWFDDEVLPYLDKLSYEKHDLTPELLRYKLLHNLAICFKYETCVIIGEVSLTSTKELYILYLAGKNLHLYYEPFLNELRQHGFGVVTGHNIGLINRLHRRNLKAHQGSFINQLSYRLDLAQLEYIKSMGNGEVVYLPNQFVSVWWDQLHLQRGRANDNMSFDLIKHKLLNNQLICYKTKNNVIIGFMSSGIKHKQFFIIWVAGKKMKSDMADFFNYLETSEFCRYVSLLCNSAQSRLYDIILKDWDKTQSTMKQHYSYFSLR